VIAPFDAEMAQLAFDAFRRYGKGQGHPARLNIVDCAAYALPRAHREPLLFKGSDFEKADIQPAV
jgi:ribonuclease VapC